MLNKENITWKRWLFFGLLTLAAVLTLTPFCRVGFTSADDLEYYFTFLKGTFWADAKNYAGYSGRFYFLFTKPLYSLPYVFDNFIITKIFQISALLFSYGAFAAMFRRIFRNDILAMAIFCVLLFFTPITSNLHIPFIAYPFFFCFSFGLTCLAVLSFLKYTESHQYRHVIISAALFLITTLFYETYLVFVALFCLFVFIRNICLHGFGRMWKTKDFYKEISPFIVVAVLYVSTYFIFRMFVPNSYDGSSFASHFSLRNAWRVMTACTQIMIPGHPLKLVSIKETLGENSMLYVGHYDNVWFMITHAPLVVYVNTALQVLILGWLLKKSKNDIPGKVLLVTMVAALFFALSSHVLIAISEKYNAVWSSWIQGYVTSYYAYFGVMTVFLAVACWIRKVTCRWKPLHIAAGVLIVVVVTPMLILTGYSNENLSREWQRIQMSHNALDEMMKKHAFDQIEDTDILYYPDMFSSGHWGSSLYGDDRNEWTDYLNLKMKRSLRGCRSAEKLKAMLAQDSTARVFYLSKKENKVHNELLLALSLLDKNTLDMQSEVPERKAECGQADIFYYSPCKKFTLAVRSLDSASSQSVMGYTDSVMLSPGWNMLNIVYLYYAQKTKSPMSVIHIEGKRLAADDFSVVNMTNEKDTTYIIVPSKR